VRRLLERIHLQIDTLAGRRFHDASDGWRRFGHGGESTAGLAATAVTSTMDATEQRDRGAPPGAESAARPQTLGT
jgi:uncharacterized protein with PIN domain